MAALATHPGGIIAMNSATSNTERILAASQKNLEAIGTVRETVTELRSDMSYVKRSVEDLTKKVDRIEEAKASRDDLRQVEVRAERAILETRTQIAKDIEQLNKDKIGVADFSVDSFDNFNLRLESMEKKIDRLVLLEAVVEEHKSKITTFDQLKWKVFGGCVAIGGVVSIVAWCIHEIGGLFGHK
jgi:chromosome segregation ATPase